MALVALARALVALSCATLVPACAAQQQPARRTQAEAAPVARAAAAPSAAQPAALPAPAAPPQPFRLAFGSCNDTQRPQLLWDAITATQPAVWLWLGDNIYADTENMTVMRGMYEALRAEPGYAALRARTRVIGTWDDHDFGHNNAGREYPMREQAQQLLLDFLDEPANSPRRDQQGVYASYDFGTPPHLVRVILLDTRYHRDPPGAAADVLGAAQWSWLQAQLSESPATVNLIASSIQVVAEDHRYEKWANFPSARARLLRLFAQSGARNVIVLSGDRHFAELSRLELGPAGQDVYDLTSSSMNRPWKDASEPNRHRIGALFAQPNFGLVEIDWRAQPVFVGLQVHDAQGRSQIDLRLPIELR